MRESFPVPWSGGNQFPRQPDEANMPKNKLRNALLSRDVTLGAWMQIGHCGIAEILARAGFDWVCVDLEHGAIDLETMTNIFRTLSAFDCVPVARLPLNDP